MPRFAIVAGELEHAEIERVEAGERHELEPVAHRAKLSWKLAIVVVVELRPPVE